MTTLQSFFKKITDPQFYIEFRLRSKGTIARSNLMNRFGCSEATATRYIREYIDAGSNKYGSEEPSVAFNKHTKENEVTKNFRPYYSITGTEIVEMLALEANDLAFGSSLLLPEKEILFTTTQAIYNNKPMLIKYMDPTGEDERIIWPHSIFNDELRFYMRAYDENSGKFTDIISSRIVEATLLDAQDNPEADETKDHQWNRWISIEMTPHPKLSNSVKKMIDFEYGMSRGKLKTRVRESMLNYYIKRYKVDNTKDASKDAKEHPLWLSSKGELVLSTANS